MTHFVVDIETLGKYDSSIVLSIGAVWFDPEEDFEYLDLVEKQSFFVKLNAKQQKEELKRTACKSTIEWWKGQNDIAKKVLIPTYMDISGKGAIEALNEFIKQAPGFDQNESVIWVRGSLDYPVLSHLAESCGLELAFGYHRIRDIRTAIDILYNSNNGYTTTSKPCVGFVAHDPVHDSARDAMLLVYGIQK